MVVIASTIKYSTSSFSSSTFFVSFHHSFTAPHSSVYSTFPTHSIIHLFVHSLTHSFVHSFILVSQNECSLKQWQKTRRWWLCIGYISDMIPCTWVNTRRLWLIVKAFANREESKTPVVFSELIHVWPCLCQKMMNDHESRPIVESIHYSAASWGPAE